MTELEKLANDYCVNVHLNGCGCNKAFQAGFKKAIELAIKLTDQSLIHCQCALHIKDMGKEKE